MFLEVRELSFGYGNMLIPSLRGLSFGIEKGEIVGIVGPSGSGKSTLLRLIAGFERPLEGSIVLDGITVAAKDVYVPPESRNVGMVFQDYGLFPHMTVRKNIEFGLRRLKGEERAMRANEMLAMAQMENFPSRYPYELSGGQQQRVSLMRALAPRPRLLLLDEPFSNLDADLREIMCKDVKTILEKEKITCLFVSHDQRDVNAVCSRIITQTY
ncbi:MAG: ABC transporter ATP-binding protein [Synergistaceae bacterium]|jgi:iron(III) transport system ATP-binding protein|nr:ABC transporter ATP-binding protein [Synergistaceae bacterium]